MAVASPATKGKATFTLLPVSRGEGRSLSPMLHGLLAGATLEASISPDEPTANVPKTYACPIQITATVVRNASTIITSIIMTTFTPVTVNRRDDARGSSRVSGRFCYCCWGFVYRFVGRKMIRRMNGAFVEIVPSRRWIPSIKVELHNVKVLSFD